MNKASSVGIVIVAVLATLGLPCAASAVQPSGWVSGDYRAGDFRLVRGTRAADILVAPSDFKVVQIVAGELAADIERVTGRKPVLRAGASGLSGHAVMVGTLGRSPLIDGLVEAGKLDVSHLIPTQPLLPGRGLRYAVGVDDEPPQLVAAGAGVEVSSSQWAQNVLNATVTASTTHEVRTTGAHVLKIYMVDAGVVLDKIVVDAGGVRPSYLGPPETRAARTTAIRRRVTDAGAKR